MCLTDRMRQIAAAQIGKSTQDGIKEARQYGLNTALSNEYGYMTRRYDSVVDFARVSFRVVNGQIVGFDIL